MSLWLLVPRDPLIFRDGKPFTAVPGERAKSLRYPFPSTVAGAVRTLAGTDPATGEFDSARIQELLRFSIRGPLLVELNEDGKINDWLFPAPADALLLKGNSDEQAVRYWLTPVEMPDGCEANLDGLTLVGPAKVEKEKPYPNPPSYWHQEQYLHWLETPQDGPVALAELGIRGPQHENRTHVSIAPETRSAIPGALFQTSGLEFTQLEWEADETPDLHQARTLALYVETDASLQEGIGALGGERRIVRWQSSQETLPACPDRLKEKIIAQKYCRLVLMTPAKFADGFLPDWFSKEYDVSVQAVALPRYQTVSGWDYDKNKPKPTSRLVPAGSVYYLKFGEKTQADAFVDSVWMQTISDDEQDRLDGFGMALLGTWDGRLRKMEVNS